MTETPCILNEGVDLFAKILASLPCICPYVGTYLRQFVEALDMTCVDTTERKRLSPIFEAATANCDLVVMLISLLQILRESFNDTYLKIPSTASVDKDEEEEEDEEARKALCDIIDILDRLKKSGKLSYNILDVLDERVGEYMRDRVTH